MAKYKNSEGCVLFRYNRGDMQTFLLSNTWISTELCVSSISSQTPLGINLFKHWFVVFPESTRWMDFTNHFTTNVRNKSKHTYYFLLNISRCKFKKKNRSFHLEYVLTNSILFQKIQNFSSFILHIYHPYSAEYRYIYSWKTFNLLRPNCDRCIKISITNYLLSNSSLLS